MAPKVSRAGETGPETAFSLVRNLYRLGLRPVGSVSVGAEVRRLRELLRDDFLRQEESMWQTGFPGTMRHRQSHNRIAAALDGVLELAERDGSEILWRRLPLLAQLILNHQVNEDRVFTAYLSRLAAR
jgi:hemerythrin